MALATAKFLKIPFVTLNSRMEEQVKDLGRKDFFQNKVKILCPPDVFYHRVTDKNTNNTTITFIFFTIFKFKDAFVKAGITNNIPDSQYLNEVKLD